MGAPDSAGEGTPAFVPTFSRNLMNRTDFSRARISKGKLFVFALPSTLSLSLSLSLSFCPALFSGPLESFARDENAFSLSLFFFFFFSSATFL